MLKLVDADSKIERELSSNTTNGIPVLLKSYKDFIRLMVEGAAANNENLTFPRNHYLQLLAGNDRTSPWHLHSQGVIFLQSAVLHLRSGDRITAGLEINRAFKILKANQKNFPDFIPGNLAMGMLHCLIGNIPDEFQWITDAFNMEGSTGKGMAEMRTAFSAMINSSEYAFMAPEAAFVYVMFAANMPGMHSNNKQFLDAFNTSPLEQTLSVSPLLNMAVAHLLMKTGRNDEALKVMAGCNMTDSRIDFPYFYFQLGTAKLNKLEPDAYIYFLKFTSSYRGADNIKTAYERIAWQYLLNSDLEKYRFYMKRIELRGATLIDSDKQASANAQKNSIPDIFLLKARLLFDGGYYPEAFSQLNAWKDHQQDNRASLEYTYRMARIFDNWGKIGLALDWYDQTLKLGSQSKAYYAANAALHKGYIYESQGNFRKAAECFNQCLSLNFDEYRYSIRQKARAGLGRIKENIQE